MNYPFFKQLRRIYCVSYITDLDVHVFFNNQGLAQYTALREECNCVSHVNFSTLNSINKHGRIKNSHHWRGGGRGGAVHHWESCTLLTAITGGSVQCFDSNGIIHETKPTYHDHKEENLIVPYFHWEHLERQTWNFPLVPSFTKLTLQLIKLKLKAKIYLQARVITFMAIR